MKSPIQDNNLFNQPRRPAKSIKEIRRRHQEDSYQSPFERLIYAVLNALLYGIGGVIVDLTIAIIRSMMGIGSGDIFWLFAPFMLVLGAIIGFIGGKNSGADSMNVLLNDKELNISHLDNYSARHDIYKGIGKGLFIFAIIWLIVMIMT